MDELIQNDLMRAKEDETGFDLLNEETFGEFGGYDEDWENEHELFAEADTRLKVGLHSNNQSPHISDEDGFDEGSFQNDVENQLTRLVLDDDDGGPFSYKSKNESFTRPYDMWADSLHLDFVKGPPVPTNGHMDNSIPNAYREAMPSFLHMNEDKKNGQVLSSKKAMTLEELEKMLLTGGGGGGGGVAGVPSSHQVTSSSSRPTAHVPHVTPPQPHMLPLLPPMIIQPSGNQPPPYHPPPPGMTVLQRPPDSRMTPLPPQSMPQHQQMLQHQQFMPNPNQQKHFQMQHLPGFMQQPPQQQQQHQSMPFSPHPSVLPPPLPNFRPSTPVPSQQVLHVSPNQFPPRPPLAYPNQQAVMHQHQMMMMMRQQQQQQLMLRQQQQQQQQQQLQFARFPADQNARHHPLQEQIRRQQFPLHLQQQFQHHQMMMMIMARQGFHPGLAGPRPHWEGGPAPPPGWHQGPPIRLTKEEMERREMKEYDGLMEQREKDWIIKIQLMQLHTDNPYVDDYYFTCWSMKRLIKDALKKKREIKRAQEEASERKGGNSTPVGTKEEEDDEYDDTPTLLVPQLAKADHKPYMPMQYEGSLGKLTASSIHNPRQIIDVHLSSAAEESKRHDSKRIKELLRKIEKSYDILLEADDIEKKALAQPTENRSKFYEERRELVRQLCTSLLGEEAAFLHQVLPVRKGALLLVRLLPLVSEDEVACEISCRILERLTLLLKREWRDEVSCNMFKSLSRVVLESNLPVERFFVAINRNFKSDASNCHVNQVIQTQLGLSLVLLIIDRMEGQVAPFPDEWCSFLHSVAKSVTSADRGALPPPFKIKTSKGQILRPGQHFSEALKQLMQHQPVDDESKSILEEACNLIVAAGPTKDP